MSARFDLTLFAEDDLTPFFGEGDEYGVDVADFSTDPAHPRPYLAEVKNWSATSIDFAAGASTIGAITVSVIDKRTDPADQGTGILTARLADVVGRRALLRRERAGEMVTAFNGVVQGYSMGGSPEGLVVISLQLRDMREREREQPLFISNFVLMGAENPDGRFGAGPAIDYGALPGGGYLLDGVGPAVGTFREATAAAAGALSWGWIQVPAQAMPDLRLLGTPALNPLDGRYYHRDVWVRWRPAGYGDDAWVALRDMPSELPDNVVEHPGRTAGPGGGLAYFPDPTVRIGSIDPADLPADDEEIEFQILASEVSAETPFFWDGGTFGTLLREIYDGEHSADPAVVPYSPEGMDDFAAVTPAARFILTEPVTNAREWVEQNIYAPTGYAPAFDDEQRVYPVAWALPDDPDSVPVVPVASLVPIGEWEHGADSVINSVEYTYIRESIKDQETTKQKTGNRKYLLFGPRKTTEIEGTLTPWERYSAAQVPIAFRAIDSIATFGAKPLKLAPVTVRSLADQDGRPLSGDSGDEAGTQLAERVGRTAIDRYRRGAPLYSAEALASDPVVAALKIGDFCRPQPSWFPDYVSGLRGVRHFMQVKSIDDQDPLIRRIVFGDSGVPDLEAGTGEEDCFAPAIMQPWEEWLGGLGYFSDRAGTTPADPLDDVENWTGQRLGIPLALREGDANTTAPSLSADGQYLEFVGGGAGDGLEYDITPTELPFTTDAFAIVASFDQTLPGNPNPDYFLELVNEDVASPTFASSLNLGQSERFGAGTDHLVTGERNNYDDHVEHQEGAAVYGSRVVFIFVAKAGGLCDLWIDDAQVWADVAFELDPWSVTKIMLGGSFAQHFSGAFHNLRIFTAALDTVSRQYWRQRAGGLPITAGGALVRLPGGRIGRVFTEDGELVNSCDHPVTLRSVLLIAGGGGGGSGAGGAGGGGGAGGVIALEDVLIGPGETIPVRVGLGGGADANGEDSVIWAAPDGTALDPLTDPEPVLLHAIGGGEGGGPGDDGIAGGSGGGGGASYPISGGANTAGGGGTPGQGSAGGDGNSSGGTSTCQGAGAGGGGSYAGEGGNGSATMTETQSPTGGAGGASVYLPEWGVTAGGGGSGASGIQQGGGVCVPFFTPGSPGSGTGAGGGGSLGGGSSGIVIVEYAGAGGGGMAATLDPPTVSSADVDADTGRVTVCVEDADWPPVAQAGYRVRVDYAVSSAAPAAASGLWRTAGYLDTPGCIVTPPVPTGAKVWSRGVAEADEFLPSVPSTATDLDAAETPALLAYALAIDEAGVGTVTWTPNAFTGFLRVRGLIHDGTVSLARPLALIADPDPLDGTYELPGVVGAEEHYTIDLETWESAGPTGAGRIYRLSEQQPASTLGGLALEEGAIPVGGTNGVPTALPPGPEGWILAMVAGIPVYVDPADFLAGIGGPVVRRIMHLLPQATRGGLPGADIRNVYNPADTVLASSATQATVAYSASMNLQGLRVQVAVGAPNRSALARGVRHEAPLKAHVNAGTTPVAANSPDWYMRTVDTICPRLLAVGHASEITMLYGMGHVTTFQTVGCVVGFYVGRTSTELEAVVWSGVAGVSTFHVQQALTGFAVGEEHRCEVRIGYSEYDGGRYVEWYVGGFLAHRWEPPVAADIVFTVEIPNDSTWSTWWSTYVANTANGAELWGDLKEGTMVDEVIEADTIA